MYRTILFFIIFIFSQVSWSFAQAPENPDVSGVLKSRKVLGVIYFKKNSVMLSKAQQGEIDRIAAQAWAQTSLNKIIRVEGFASKHDHHNGLLKTAFLRAKSVWYYLDKSDSLKSHNLFLTGFSLPQSISQLQGERVEIAVYENPFNGKMDIYSNN